MATTALLAQIALGQLALAGTVHADDTAQASDDVSITSGGVEVGRHYRQTGGGTGLGYDVREPFFSPFQALGGPAAVGFPVSVPFRGADGCAYQDFQVLLLQACPGLGVRRANTFQILEEAGMEGRLEQLGIGRGLSDGSSSFDDAVRIRLGWLEDQAIRERYLAQCGDGESGAGGTLEQAIEACGLPMNHPQSFGPFVSQRFQRIAFQRWLADGPGGIRSGDVSAVLGGDLLKATGVLSGVVAQPHAFGQVPTAPVVAFGRAAPVAAADASPPRRAAPLQYGFQGDFLSSRIRSQAIQLIKEADFGWAKQQVPWDQYEMAQVDCLADRVNCVEQLVNGRQKFFRRDQLAALDAVVESIAGAGLNVLLSVVRAPAFRAAPGGHAPSDPETLRDFLQFLAGRYRGKVKAIEPWNEQNLSWEWGGARLWPNAPAAPPQGVVDFVALQKAAYQGVKAGDANVLVVLPALTPTGLGECWLDPAARSQGFCLQQVQTAIDDRLYLDFLYQVNNGEIKSYFDVLGVHPSGYNNPPDDFTDVTTVRSTNFKGHGSFYIKRYQQLHAVQVKYGDTKPMWFTEVGWSVTRFVVPGYEYGLDNTEAQRGRYVARLLEQVERDGPYVTNVILWNLNFRQLVPEPDEKYGFGLVNTDGSPTSAYTCAADFVRNGNRITRPDCGVSSAGPAGGATGTPSATATATATATAAGGAAASATATPTLGGTGTATAAAAGTTTATPTPAGTGTPSSTPTGTATAAATPTGTVTPSPGAAASATPTRTPTPAP